MTKTVDQGFHQELGRLLAEGTLSGLTDAELLDRYLNRRDETAFELLLRQHGPMVLGLCRRMLRDRQEVEDAFQATFLILIRKGRSLRDRTLLANWLYGVAYRVAVQAKRKSARRNAGKQPAEFIDDLADPIPPAESSDWIPILDQELTRLPEKYRVPLILCYLKERTHEQSAGELGIPVGTVRSRLARGREMLKQRLARRGITSMSLMTFGAPIPPSVSVPTSLVQGMLGLSREFWSQTPRMAAFSGGPARLSAISLAQGVISTMLLGKVKMASIGLIVVAVLAGGIAQGVRATAPAGGEPSKPVPAPAKSEVADGSKDKGAPESFEQGLKTQMTTIERKIDQLIAQMPISGSRLTGEEPSRRSSATMSPLRVKPQNDMTLPEFETELRILKRRLAADRDFIKFQLSAHRAHAEGRLAEVISAQQRFNDTGDAIQRLIGKLNRYKQELDDELATLVSERNRREAEVRIERASVEQAKSKVVRNERVDRRVPGTVSEEDRAKDEIELKLASAREDAVAADLDYLTLRAKFIDSPRKAVDALIAEAKALDLSENPEPSTSAKPAPK